MQFFLEFQKSKPEGAIRALTDVLVPRFGDDERASSRLLRDPVVVDLPVERVAVLLPAVPGKESKRS